MASGAILFLKRSSVLTLRAKCSLLTSKAAHSSCYLPTAKHKLDEFPIPTADTYPLGITAGPDGNLWFTEAYGNNIGQLR
jgi:streptogramin lyase